MVVYRGVLHDQHLYAVIRTALRAHGFALSDAGYRAASREQWRVGFWWRDRGLPQCLAGAVTLADYGRIAAEDPRLWHQLPLMGALGYRQTQALLGLMRPAQPQHHAAAVLGAVFNTGIALFDYLVDESSLGGALFDAVNPDIVGGLLDPASGAQAELARAGRLATDPRLRLLLAIVGAFATLSQRLVGSGGNHAAGRDLSQLVAALFHAERAVSVGRAARANPGDLLPALETKSALPSLTLLHIAMIGSSAPSPLTTRARQAAAALGHVLWRVDDLVDLLTDCRTGSPSALLQAVAEQVAARGGSTASDGDLYDVVDVTAAEIVDLLGSGVFGSERSSDPLERALSRVGDFARETVAGWTRWHEDAGLRPAAVVGGDLGRTARTCAADAVDMLLAAQRDGYREAVHQLRFPRHGAHGLAHETHGAMLFQRAVVLDSLLDARSAGLDVPQRVVDSEAVTLLRLKHRYVRGGWNYLPQVPEIPPDADDLGQVLQVLVRVGGDALAFTCEEPVRLALDAAQSHGGFPTWIFDPRGRSAADRRMRAYLNVIGGAGVHPDVVANLLQGLLLYGPDRYRAAMLRALAYLESTQDERGAWPSQWYAGPYYGTYRVAAVFAALAPHAKALDRACRFLVDDQRPDGGWGEAASEPLSTALAVLALSAAGGRGQHDAIARGVEYLAATERADGGWAASPWIAFETQDGIETHGSRTIATAFSLKALVAGSRSCATRRVAARSARFPVTNRSIKEGRDEARRDA